MATGFYEYALERHMTAADLSIVKYTADLLPEPPAGRDVVLHTRVVTDTGGGPDKTILVSASFLDHTNYWLAAAYMHPPGDPGFETVRQRAAGYRCPLIGVPDKGALDRGPLRELLGICKQMNVKIWHGHDYKSNMLGLMLRPFWRQMKLVTTVHGWVKHTTRTPLYYAVDRWCLPYYHHVICVSQDLLEQMEKIKVDPARCSLIHNAIDHRMFSRKGPACDSPMRAERGTPKGRLVIGGMGRLSPEKGFNDLIYAAASLIQDGRNIELWIAGDGDHRPELEKLIDHLGMTDRVKLLGFVGDTMAFYESLDLFVLSSLREGLPNVLLESMSMGAAVVSTRVAGVPKLIEDNTHGLLVPIGQRGQLTDAIRKAVDDEPLRKRLVDAARSRIEREFSFEHRMRSVQAIYDNVLADDDKPVEQIEAGGSPQLGG